MAGVPAGRGIRLEDAGAGHAAVVRTWRPPASWAASAQVLPHMELDTGMRAVVQRVSAAMVAVDGAIVGQIGRGLVVLVGVTHGDGEPEVEWLAEKLATLRIFEDQDGKMNASVQDTGGAALVVSQFTLYADARRGRRPSFTAAAVPEQAAPLVQRLTAALSRRGIPTASGQFGAHMDVALHNDGPVTIILETPAR